MASPIVIPQLSMTMTEASVAHWLKGEGEFVEVGEPVLEIETEKVTQPVEALVSGILHIFVPEGATNACGETVGALAASQEEYRSLLADGVMERPPAAAATAGRAPVAAGPSDVADRVKASPAARRMARELGIDLGLVPGTGPAGRIQDDDVRQFAAQAAKGEPQPIFASSVPPVADAAPGGALTAPEASPAAAPPEARPAEPGERRVGKVIPQVGLRKSIAERMMYSLRTTAQLSASYEVDATELVRLREQLTTQADRLSFLELSRATAALVEKARAGTLTLGHLSGGTFTLSNVGNFPVSSFTPVLNPPESAILGVGGIVEKPVVVKGEIAIGSMLTICMSWDHRVADGIPARPLRNHSPVPPRESSAAACGVSRTGLSGYLSAQEEKT